LKFHAANGKAQPALKVSCSFFFQVLGGRGWGRGRFFFIFHLFQQVPNNTHGINGRLGVKRINKNGRETTSINK
jgi:hypothetical protein